MIRFLKDLKNFIILKKNIHLYKVGFFTENNFIYEYLEPYILRKIKKKRILILSFEDIQKNYLNVKDIFIFKTKFFQQIVFLTLNLKFLYSSTPNLNSTIFQISKTSKCKYLYLSHTPVSMNLIYSLNAFDHFDAVQVISDYQYNEMIEIKKKRKLKLKIFKSKYLFIEKKIQILQKNKFSTDILIAPSWNSNFYSSKCHLILNEKLKNKGVTFKLRPHPMSFKNGETSLSELKKEEIQIDRDIFLNFQNYNFLISDWSGIFIEYALIFKKKAFLINTPKKMVNENYLIYENEPIEISLRNVFAKNFEIDKIPQMVEEIIIQKNSNESPQNEEIKKIIKNKFY